mmetsp:Transcript_47783/g.70719  ORF Transcript_47783/g.70719 Transcript_47783/m.70719 type:complete len:86 (+) Transcript_47783:258-515(+)
MFPVFNLYQTQKFRIIKAVKNTIARNQVLTGNIKLRFSFLKIETQTVASCFPDVLHGFLWISITDDEKSMGFPHFFALFNPINLC